MLKIFRKCTKCLVIYPSTSEYFYRGYHLPAPHLLKVCKVCDNKTRSERYFNKTSHNHPRICVHCKEQFYATLADINRHKRKGTELKYCSIKCIDRTGARRKHFTWGGRRKGEFNPCARLKEHDVRIIKDMLSKGERIVKIAALYNVSRGTIASIKSNRTWTHIIQT